MIKLAFASGFGCLLEGGGEEEMLTLLISMCCFMRVFLFGALIIIHPFNSSSADTSYCETVNEMK